MIRVVESRLVSSAGAADRLPPPSLPEAAFGGRSNVGKSSLLNALCNRKGLFKVSRTPGRTRTIMHVEARLRRTTAAGGEAQDSRIFLVDLPGYGYARASRGAREAWSRLVTGYLNRRETLRAFVLLVDARRGLEDEERALLELIRRSGRTRIVAATKTDKMRSGERLAALDAMRREAGTHVVGTSAETREGIEELLELVATACGVVPLRFS